MGAVSAWVSVLGWTCYPLSVSASCRIHYLVWQIFLGLLGSINRGTLLFITFQRARAVASIKGALNSIKKKSPKRLFIEIAVGSVAGASLLLTINYGIFYPVLRHFCGEEALRITFILWNLIMFVPMVPMAILILYKTSRRGQGRKKLRMKPEFQHLVAVVA